LTIAGREKDIIINGVNYYSHEIESVVEEIEGVERSCTAACAVRLDDVDGERLAIFFHPSSKEGDLKVLIQEIRRRVVARLGINPAFSIPIEEQEIPRTSIGKIDRPRLSQRFQAGEFKALVERLALLASDSGFSPVATTETESVGGGLAGRVSRMNKTEHDLPRTELERQLTGIVQEVLRGPRLGAHANFFDFGGNSIAAARIVSRVHSALQVALPLRVVFENPTVFDLAKIIEKGAQRDSNSRAPSTVPVPRDEYLPLSFGQQRLWFLDQLDPGNSTYNIPVGFRLTGSLDVKALEQSFNEIVRRHEVLRTTFSTVEGRPAQIIAPTLILTPALLDLQGLPEPARSDQAQRLIADEAKRKFELERGPLLRCTLLRLQRKTISCSSTCITSFRMGGP
jgi:hypothetical protein